MIKLILIIVFAVAAGISLPSNAAQQSNAIFDAYSRVGLALSQDQLTEATKHGKQLHSAITAADHKKAKDELLPPVEALINAKNLDEARKSYELLSSRLSQLKKDLGIPGEEYYCSMLKKYWLQKDPKIVNPYGGKDMASCGEKKKNS
jgi:hypothetical protein